MDLVLIAMMAASFAIVVLFVRWCERLIKKR